MTLSIVPRLILGLTLFSTTLHAQELVKPSTTTTETNVAERMRLLESELERQNSKLDQLQKTLSEQQQTIQALLEKLSGQQPATTAVAAAKKPVAGAHAAAQSAAHNAARPAETHADAKAHAPAAAAPADAKGGAQNAGHTAAKGAPAGKVALGLARLPAMTEDRQSQLKLPKARRWRPKLSVGLGLGPRVP